MNKLVILTAAVLAASPALASKGPNLHEKALACVISPECTRIAAELHAEIAKSKGSKADVGTSDYELQYVPKHEPDPGPDPIDQQ
jgi:hypothetical protein